ncbi:ArdC family protein [Paenibacillus pasadenensis]|uniref:ArdC family protein n=1 Tax=Paenibacillus pasadenensis TaxID=217090 RepID=UPI00048BA32A|nr:zincin-like metallopeptidase domain-containing protein [Paenibacillus pasadenensis]
MSDKIYQLVTERILVLLERGVVPWEKPWRSGRAVNWKTQKPYRGINTILLEPGEYATFKQVREAGGSVKKGEKGWPIVFWTFLEREREEQEPEKIPFLRHYTVFEINRQCEGLRSKRGHSEEGLEPFCPLETAEQVVSGYEGGPRIKHAPGRAFYRPSADFISVPKPEDFFSAEKYYSTLFHEMVHSTGHENRLNRPGIVNSDLFGGESYSKEELVAELGAAMLSGVAGIESSTIENSAAYIAGWMRAIKDDAKLIVQAAGLAQKAADHILGVTFDREE